MQTPEEYEVTLRINAILKELKKRRGFTKKVVSEKLGIGLTTLDDYMNGVSSFRLGTLLRLAELAKLSLSDILDSTDAFTEHYNKEASHDKTQLENMDNVEKENE
ncbi:helix-turn-helix domain-containing protein [Pseudoalteromonas fenneropenaei]|uniref:Helix-turn-helix domain-containing protein n=1 Tax=Pseudoalteromonas fenneropenaei TaxID=1737459 RepID=A0ABV7CJE6_9GAMM